MSYDDFIARKELDTVPVGFECDESALPAGMFEHQTATVKWACRKGRAGVFFDTGLGKTITQLAWAEQVQAHTDGYVLILTPLAVAKQTERESVKFGMVATFVEYGHQIKDPGIYITNYEKLHHFDTSIFAGVVLDESSILKGMMGKVRQQITDSFAGTPYRLSCTATPSPNDFMELGTQSEFLGIMSQTEMLAMFFIHDTGGGTGDWRLKHHGKAKFWKWLSTWCVFLRSPADMGLPADGYDLPPIEYYQHTIETQATNGLFVEPAQSLQERNQARRDTVEARCQKAADIVNALEEPCIVWCNLNAESELLSKLIDGAVSVSGSDTSDHKANSILDFADRKIKCLISKPKICGFGVNLQATHHCVFVGLSDSWEAYYQAIRRQWRFGQDKAVQCHIVSADVEGLVVENIRRKDAQHAELSAAMMDHMAEFMRAEVFGSKAEKTDYLPTVEMEIPEWLHSQ
jgi:hypothetical protein